MSGLGSEPISIGIGIFIYGSAHLAYAYVLAYEYRKKSDLQDLAGNELSVPSHIEDFIGRTARFVTVIVMWRNRRTVGIMN